MQIYLAAFAVLSFFAMQIEWGSRTIEYGVWLVFGLVGSIGFSGVVLPMVTNVVLPQDRSTAFALLFSFVQGALAALLSLALGVLAQQYGLRRVMLSRVTIPYAINAVFWFVFYIQNDVRNKLDLSGIWDFKTDPNEVGERAGWFNGLASPRRVAVPGSWNEQYEDTYNYTDLSWYVRRTFVPSSWQGQRVLIRVGSANYYGAVYVNGVKVGEHEGGHRPFAFEITDQVQRNQENVIARDKNHASVVMWCVANEPMPTTLNLGNLGASTSGDPSVVRGKQFLDTLLRRARELDSTRLVTLVTVMGGPQSWMQECDVICMNRYWGWYVMGGEVPD